MLFIALAAVIQHGLTGPHNFRISRISVLIFNISLLLILSLTKSVTIKTISCLDLLFLTTVKTGMLCSWGSPFLYRQRRSILSIPVHIPVSCVTVFGFVPLCALSVLGTGGKKSLQRFVLRVVKFWWEWILAPLRQELPLLLNKNYRCLQVGLMSAFGNR